ncbi:MULTISPECIES: PQQ-binding-like beta-propeller repeat protein [unclassified Caballeronia]|uniref:PQQ-binding-like beta-propeller repeat protein n=1 Tax=unclassified Caballeronia TaxID=2646786 RepID=UPI00285C57A8|nr:MULTISPECIES: PQQ-binding-like beta-propeller repeat protein [unclassified Caballeronia]MDR5753270.1 PQQ-binding-like beta-propeller repeat protein [Caballeronia sp. LZ024]MDR5841009.1 PQQ-binding-like beta-propeller repeat protein [Caballeronia sp. LZ031]
MDCLHRREPFGATFRGGLCGLLFVAALAGCSGGSSSQPATTTTGGSSPASAPAGGSGAASGASPASGGGTGTGSNTGGGAGNGTTNPPTGGNTATANPADVTTYHNDIARTGQRLNETALTPSTVKAATFGKLGVYAVDGAVDAEPLYLASMTIAGGTHNVLYIATENASVYALDADTGAKLWQVSALAQGETPSDNHGCLQITPKIGITATPVIDRSRGPNGAIYVVAMSKDGSGNYHQRIHALDVTTGAELFGGPTEIAASYPGNGAGSSNGRVVFDPAQYAERQSLLLLNGVIYTGWTSHCDIQPYTGWVISYSADTLKQAGVLNLTPNGSGGAIWMSGAGMASDGTSIYFLDANGTFDSTLNAAEHPLLGDYGNGFLKLSPSPTLSVADYFQASNTVQQSNADEDLGSGGALVLPDLADASGTIHHLALGAGKDSIIYVVNRDSMGKFDSNADHIYQEISGQITGPEFGMPAYWNNTVYFGSIGDHIKAFRISNARLGTAPASQSPNSFGSPGTTPSISANGNTNGIVWAAENGTIAVLHAYDATNLATELYNSNQSGSRDQFGPGNKFITPMIANGKVYVGTSASVAVFGLLR